MFKDNNKLIIRIIHLFCMSGAYISYLKKISKLIWFQKYYGQITVTWKIMTIYYVSKHIIFRNKNCILQLKRYRKMCDPEKLWDWEFNTKICGPDSFQTPYRHILVTFPQKFRHIIMPLFGSTCKKGITRIPSWVKLYR